MIPLRSQIDEARNLVLCLRAQMNQVRRYRPEVSDRLVVRLEQQAAAIEALIADVQRKQEDAEILEWVDRNRDKIKQRMSY